MVAICEYGSYEDYGVYFVKINPKDKDIFKQYCLDSQKIGGNCGTSLHLKGFSELNYKNFIDDLDRVDIKINLGIDYITIGEHQKIISDKLNYIHSHGNHYLKDKTKELTKLLEYKFN